MACGTGKTLVGLWLAEALDARRTLILLPSLSLLAQTLREWTANAASSFALLPVCSDETVRGDHWVSHTSDLGFPVTTDPSEIAAFLRRRKQPSVVFSTYQSSPKIAEAYGEGRVPLDSDAIKARNRLFMTATPRFFTGRVKKAAGESDYEIASMDDEAHFGPEFHRLTFGEAIERDLLSDYLVVIVGVDDPTYREYAERGTFVSVDGDKITDARTLASHIALAKATKKYDLRRTISFHSRIKRARQFSTAFPAVVEWMPEDEQPDGVLVTDHVSGQMPSGQRDTRLDRLRDLDDDERGLLSNARCLSEGVDVPTLDGVAFIDPRRSQVDIVQAVGRAIRKAEDKTLGTIVLPVFVESSEDPETALSESAFDHVWQVLKALRDHDDVFADVLDEWRRALGRLGAGAREPPSRWKVIFEGVDPEFARAFQLRLVEQTTANWEFWYGLLERHVEREGHAGVLADHVEEGRPLGRWVHNQRTEYRQGRLSSERVRRLESVHGWIWHPREAKWETGLSYLLRFVGREGHARVPGAHVEAGYELGRWVSRQRTSCSRGRLREDRQRRLESLDGWVWDAASIIWDEGLEWLKQYVEREGHASVPLSHVEGDYPLGSWVRTQRAWHYSGQLSPERVEALEAVRGWVWDIYAAQWETGYEHLLRFIRREGHAKVPARYSQDGFQLGQWVDGQRQAYRRGKLAADRVARLQRLEFWVWDIPSARWAEAYEHLQQFVEREGHAIVPQPHVEGRHRLGAWVSQQRLKWRQGRLARERAKRLEALPGWAWDAREVASDDED